MLSASIWLPWWKPLVEQPQQMFKAAWKMYLVEALGPVKSPEQLAFEQQTSWINSIADDWTSISTGEPD